jgi:hypothetical protein
MAYQPNTTGMRRGCLVTTTKDIDDLTARLQTCDLVTRHGKNNQLYMEFYMLNNQLMCIVNGHTYGPVRSKDM